MPEKRAKLHEHPRFDPVRLGEGKKTHVYGRRLVPGDVIEENDVYDSMSGAWETVTFHGLTVQEGAGAIFVRPVTRE